MYQSEIRESTINALFEKVQKLNYQNYLSKMHIDRLRGFTNCDIKFDFPVTALIGPNGGGKTTILGAAALIFQSIKPRRFFAKSGKYDNSMKDWRVEYEIIDKKQSPTSIIKRTASYGNYKWSRGAIVRNIGVFGISRTVPPTEKIEYNSFASNTFEVEEGKVHKLNAEVAIAVSKILGKDVSGYSELQMDDKGDITFLTGRTETDIEYSEFHFGAGESSIIRMVSSIEKMFESAIILIEEIENGLHPVATIRLVEYLIDVAERKKAQVIFTTHSNESLLPLPNNAIWVACNNSLYQGKLDIASLRAITGKVESKIAIFTEDIFSKEWMESVIRHNDKTVLDIIEVHGLEGDGMAVRINKSHNSDPSIKTISLCFLDGDSRQVDNPKEKIFRLPGESPEGYIYDCIIEKIDECKGELSVALLLKYEENDEMKKTIKEIRQSNRDEHLLFSQVGKKLGFLPENIVRNAFFSIWNKYFEEESIRLYANIDQYID